VDQDVGPRDDKDRVYVRSGGAFTYFATDCAYYLNKRAWGFDRIMIVMGAYHHGYVNPPRGDGRQRALRHETMSLGGSVHRSQSSGPTSWLALVRKRSPSF
jgi:arginyl-tRNA synthetase